MSQPGDELAADSRPPASSDDLPVRVRGMVQAVERMERAAKLMVDGHNERDVAKMIGAEFGLEWRRSWDVVSGALEWMARSHGRVAAPERRAQLLEKARRTYQLAEANKRNYSTRDDVVTLDEPDLKAMQKAIELEAKLCGLDDAPTERRVWSEVIAALRNGLSPAAFVDAIEALGQARGGGMGAAPVLPAKGGDDEAG